MVINSNREGTEARMGDKELGIRRRKKHKFSSVKRDEDQQENTFHRENDSVVPNVFALAAPYPKA